MQRIAVLSPHRDDAVFSLAHALRFWTDRSIPLRVINVFTISNYAPRAVSAASCTTAELSALRKVEDRRAIRRISSSVLQHDLPFLDAPLAYNIEVVSVSGPHAMAPDQHSVTKLAMSLESLLQNSLVVAPLGLGNHINHLMVKQAALDCVPPGQLAFYEDLPYADWTTEQEWTQRLNEAARNGKVRLASSTIRSANTVRWKQSAVRLYQTQIDHRDANLIAAFGRRYGAGERLWFPCHSAGWRALSRLLPTAKAPPRKATPGPPRREQV